MTKPEAGGRLTVVCASAAGRSWVRTVRYDGLARASRPLDDARGACHLVTATLGPGLIAGDRVQRDVDVETGASLLLTSQMATPVFAGDAASRSDVRSRVAPRAALYAPGEVLLLASKAVHESHAWIDVAADGLALSAEIAVLGASARLRTRTVATIDGRLVLRDACDLAGDGSQRALLTATVVTADVSRRAALAHAFAAILGAEPGVRGGVGATEGATIVRAHASGAWALQRLLEDIVAATRAAFVRVRPAA